ncbi:hypothetical protein FOMPIDRAFT_1053093 [Fomitopsis schrenkii]|uniref:F-box domain-containing protein n=1 Tax=Fomitopsis schrenkii TaxID=2126942 RepID=S8F4F5_FOMSC|nr:hypothetical protein FOMPIDRAFT_1053093 [Fomitopsis schrenkii]
MPPLPKKVKMEKPRARSRAKSQPKKAKAGLPRGDLLITDGRLASILIMPADIVREICLCLHPRDLLSLCRTAKLFHGILMYRDFAPVWRDCLKQVDGLPQCPPGLIEPAYVSLLFSPTCTGCGKRATSVYWVWFARFCAACKQSKVVSDEAVAKFLTDTQRESFEDLKVDEDDEAEVFAQAKVSGYKRPCYLKLDLLQVLAAYREATDKNEFRQERFRVVSQCEQFAAECQDWQEEERQIQKEEKEIREANLKALRLYQVMERLCALGWSAEIDYLRERGLYALKNIKAVCVPKELTNNAWSKMRAEVVQCMTNVQTERLQHEFQMLLKRRYAVLVDAGNELLDRQFAKRPELLAYGLNTADLALQNEFRAIMCRPSDVEIARSDFLALDDRMDVIVERWETYIQKHLRKPVVKAAMVSPRAAGIDPLNLATTIFKFGKSDQYCNFFPFFTAFNCSLRTAPPGPRGSLRVLSPYERFVFEKDPGPFRHTGFATTRVVKPSPDVLAIIEMAGQDPDTVTAAEMDALDLRWVDSKNEVHKWRDAIAAASVENRTPGGWRLATPEESVKAKEIEFRHLQESDCRLWRCNQCSEPQAPMSWVHAEEHLHIK